LAYLPLPYEKAKCLAHILKSLKDVEALQTGDALDFPRSAINLFKDAIELEKHRFQLGIGSYQDARFCLEKRLDRLLDLDDDDPQNVKLAKRIRKYRDEWFVFLYNVDVEATNNLAERQIRPFVLCRKISAGTHPQDGYPASGGR